MARATNRVTDPDEWREPPRCPVCDEEDWNVEKHNGRLYCSFCAEDVTPMLTEAN